MENTHDYLIDMLIPSLDSPEYANQLDTAFQNIKTNFSILANTNFVKGETGDSSNLQIEPLVVDYNGDGTPYLTAYGYNVLNTIHPGGVTCLSTSTEFPIPLSNFKFDESGVYSPVSISINNIVNNNDNTFSEEVETKTYHWYSQFTSLNDDGDFSAGNLYIISKRNGNTAIEEATPFSSLYYTFLDYRFYNENVGAIDEDTFEVLEDMSCVLVLTPTNDGYSFKKYDAFPTMYYEDNVGLCWRINGSKTGMPVRGIPGADGKNAILHIVKANATTEEDKCTVVEIFDNGFKKLNDINAIKTLNGQSAIVFVPTTIKNNFYFSKLYLDDSDKDESKWSLYTYCKEDNALNTQIAYNDFINILKAINLYKADTETVTTLKGLFIPIQIVDPNSETESTEEESADDDTSKSNTQAVHLMTAVNTFDSGTVESDKPNLLFTAINDVNTTEDDAYKMYIDTYMYLEYDKTLIATNSKDDPEYKYFYGWGTPATHMLKYKLSNFITSVDAIDALDNGISFSDELKTAILKSGIYQWMLDTTIDNYDVDELKLNSQNNIESYPFNSEFGPIYTLSSTPGVDSDFYWYCQYNNYENDEQSGWTKKKFIFRKLVPICINNNAYNKDTTLNLNYNVNVLGDNLSNGSHNLTVHGNISSNSANVYGSLTAKDYKNIYTSTVIKGDEGIELGKISNSESNTVESAFVVDSGGSITKSSSINSNSITTKIVNADNVDITNAISCNTFKLSHADTIGMSAEIVSFDNDSNFQNNFLNNTSNVSINNTNNIKIYRNTNIDNISLDKLNDTITSDIIPHIGSEVPLFMNNNANIVITNTSDVNDVYVNFSNTGDLPMHFRNVDANNKTTIDFNSAKDYSLYKITKSSNSTTNKFKSEHNSVSLNTFNTTLSSWTDELTTATNENEDLKKWAIATFKITKKNESDSLINNIKFGLSEYLLKVTVNGRCHHGCWPYMTGDSKIELNYYYATPNSPGLTFLYTDATTYKFSDTNTSWYGINHTEGDYSGKDRYYYYKFSPKSFTCYSRSTTFNTLETEFGKIHSDSAITIYIVPKIKVSFISEENWLSINSNIKSVKVEAFNFNSTTSKSESSIISRTTLKSFPAVSKYVNAFCEYNISSTTNNSQHKSTTICDNGIVFTSGKYIFGLGYAEHIYNHDAQNKSSYTSKDNTKIWGNAGSSAIPGTNESIEGSPVLFFVDSEATGVKDWIDSINKSLKNSTNKKTINFNYNRAINTIPLKDIFEAIKHLRKTETNEWKKFGL